MDGVRWKGVCLDFDGTLAEFRGDFDVLLDSLRLELGLLACDFRTFRERLGWELRADGPLDLELALSRLLAWLGLDARSHELAGLAERTCEDYARQVELRPGALDLLELLEGTGTPLALISNGPADMQRSALARVGIGRRFRALLVSGDPAVGVRKPNARIFALACGALGVSPAEAVMIGDDLGADVEGALGLGMGAIHLGGVGDREGRWLGASDLAAVGDMLAGTRK